MEEAGEALGPTSLRRELIEALASRSLDLQVSIDILSVGGYSP